MGSDDGEQGSSSRCPLSDERQTAVHSREVDAGVLGSKVSKVRKKP